MTYDRREIMTQAWTAYRRLGFRKFAPWQFAYCLRSAWTAARRAVSNLVNLPQRREALKAEIARLTYSDAMGTAHKLQRARAELETLPLAA